jgi:hypothetical protein
MLPIDVNDSMTRHLLEVGQLLSTFSMFGIIWIVQLVLYPAFADIAPSSFLDFHKMHTQRITWVVGPLMALELFCATGLIFSHQLSSASLWNLASVLTLFAITALVSVPQHTRLSSGQDAVTIRRLVTTNWIRTWLWTFRVVALIAVCIG